MQLIRCLYLKLLSLLVVIVLWSGLADITLESRKDLKHYITKLAKIILKKEQAKNVDEAHENQEDFKKTASTAS